MGKQFIVGIDLGGTNLKIALLDLKYRIKDKKNLKTQKFSKKETLLEALADSVDKIIAENKLRKKDILGVGLGVPGPVDTKRGIVHFFPNIPGWKKVGLKRSLEREIGLPVFLDNDANLMALAEYSLGRAAGFANAVCLTLGTGVGGGIIVAGRLYRGGSGAAGEVGHLPVNEKGSHCNCGGIACLETYVGNNRIIEKARKIFKKNISLEELSRLARDGNKKAQNIWSDIGRILGIALSGVVNLLNPDCLVIGGGIANAGKSLFEKIRKTIKSRAMTVQARHVKVFKARLGHNAGLIGAAILVKEHYIIKLK